MEKRQFWTVCGGKSQATEIYKSEPDDELGFYGNEWEWHWHGYAGSREQAKYYAYEAMYEFINRKLED